MCHYFETSNLKEYDIKAVVDILKKIEDASIKIITNKAANIETIKNKFFPIETY